MHLPSLALPLLNATNTLLHNASSVHTPSDNGQVFCYVQRPPDLPQRAPATYVSCMNLARRLVATGKPHAQVDFSRDKELGLKTPWRVYGGFCVFEVYIDPENVREKSWAASFYEIGLAAIEIMTHCVVPEPHLGGITKVGRDHVLDLKVYGNSIDESTI